MKWYSIGALLLTAALSGGWTHGISNASFQGDPNASVSAISGSITCSRTSGTTPMFVQCSASAITATGSSVPYEQGEYSWNFGDASGTETISDPFSGSTVNLNNGQVQPEAAYVYRNANNYTITLNVRFCKTTSAALGCTAYTTASFTQPIAVTAFNPSGGTFYYSASGSGTTCSIGSPCAISQFASKLANNTQHYFNKGDTFSGTTNIQIQNFTGVRIGSFGSGAVPKINISSGTNPPLVVQTGASGTTTDVVVSGVEFDVTGSATSPNNAQLASAGTGTLQNIYLDNCVLSDSLDISGFENYTVQVNTFGSDTNNNIGLWMTAMSSPLSATTTFDGILAAPYSWFFAYGGSIQGAGNDHTRDHHIYMHTQLHLAVSYMTFGNSDPTGLSPTRNFNVKLSYDPGQDGPAGFGYAQYDAVTHNSMTGTQRASSLGNNTNDPSISRFKNVVYAKNVKQGFTGDELPANGETATYRDEIYCNNGTDTLNGLWTMTPLLGTTTYLKASIYRQRIYQTVGAAPVFDFQPASFTWTVPEEFTDNQAQCTASNCYMMSTVFSQQVSSGSTWDRNDWYCPSTASGACFFNGTSGQTLATWQASGFDTHGNQNNPNFPAPASCNLGPRQP